MASVAGLLSRFMLENWYYEMIHEGAPLSLCFLRMRVYGRSCGVFTVRSPSIQHSAKFTGADLKVIEDGKRVMFGPGTLTEDENGSRLFYKGQGLKFDLRFDSPTAPYMPNKNGVLFERRGLFVDELLRWTLPVPIAHVTGSLNDATIDTVGTHDFLETNLSASDFPLQALHKGRFYADPDSIITFLDIRYRESLKRPPETFAVYAHKNRDPIESERTLLIRDEVDDGLVTVGTAVMSYDGRELEFLFRNTDTLLKSGATDVLPFVSETGRKLFKKAATPIRLAQFVSATPSGDRVIHGVHDLLY